MRILFLLTQDLQSPSGLGRYGPMAKELAKLGETVEICALHPDYYSLGSPSVMLDGVKIRYVAPMHVRKKASQKTYYRMPQFVSVIFQSTWKLTRSALSTPADLVVMGKPHPMNGIAGLITKIFRKETLSVDCDDYEAASNKFTSAWQKTGVAFFENRLPKYTKLVTTNTCFMRDRLISKGVSPHRILYVPNGVERERFININQDDVEILRSELGLIGKKVILYVGSHSLISHPVDLLLKAFLKLKREITDSILVLVGGGEDFRTLQTLAIEMGIASDVIFCGRVPPEKVPLYYQLGDVSVDPVHANDASRGRCPLKLFESWAAGVPFVTADVGDRRLLAGDPSAALLATPGDVESLASEITKILMNKDLASNMHEIGYTRVENYWWDNLVKELAARYRQFIKSPTRQEDSSS